LQGKDQSSLVSQENKSYSKKKKQFDKKLVANGLSGTSLRYRVEPSQCYQLCTTDVPAGRDNRWSELHPARFMPGVACSAIKEYTTAREVIGLTSPPPAGCYDLTSVGMGGFVTARGWIEMGNNGSTKMKVRMFNLNNASKSSTITVLCSGTW
jgi:hypothetical protein